MRLIGNDRSRFPSNPPDISRKIERRIGEDDSIEVRKIGGLVYDVTGLIPSQDSIIEIPLNYTYFATPSGSGYFI